VIVSAADQEIATAVALSMGQDVQLRASVKNNTVVVER
jgi:hypothetical protein